MKITIWEHTRERNRDQHSVEDFEADNQYEVRLVFWTEYHEINNYERALERWEFNDWIKLIMHDCYDNALDPSNQI